MSFGHGWMCQSSLLCKLCQECMKLCQVGQPAARDNSWWSCVPDSGLTEVKHGTKVELLRSYIKAGKSVKVSIFISCQCLLCKLRQEDMKSRQVDQPAARDNPWCPCVPDSGLMEGCCTKMKLLRSYTQAGINQGVKVSVFSDCQCLLCKLRQETTKSCQVGQPAARDNPWCPCVPDSGLTEGHCTKVKLFRSYTQAGNSQGVNVSILSGCNMAGSQEWEYSFSISNKARNKLAKCYNGNGKLRHTINIMHWNAGNKHWKRKIEEIEALTIEKMPDLLFITEANLMDSTPEAQRLIPGYNITLPLTMDNLKYARIVLLVKHGLEVKVLHKHMEEDLSTIWVKVGQAGRKPLTVGGIYREHHLLQPNAPRGTPNISGTPAMQQDRWRRVIKGWKAASKDTKCIVIGDLNLDYSKWMDPEPRHVRMTDMVKQEIEPCGFTQLMNNHTRAWPQQVDSTVDHCWVNTPERIIAHHNFLRTGSDHNVISVTARMKDRVQQVLEVEKRMWKNLDPQLLISDLKEADWTELLASSNIDVINGILEETLRTALDKQAPVRTIQVRNSYKNWVTTDLKDKMTTRDTLRETARLSGEAEDWTRYRQCRNEVTKDTISAKDQHFRHRFEVAVDNNDAKQIFGLAKELSGITSCSQPTSFLIEGRLVRKPKDLANAQLEHYATKIENLRGKQWPKEDDPLNSLRSALGKWSKKDQMKVFNFKEINLLETSKLVKGMSNSVSFGHDQLDAVTMKLVLPQILIPLNHLINTSLQNSKVAMKWKLAKVLPLLKSKDSNRLDPANYRPISLLSTTAKIVERAAQVQLLKHFEESQLLNNSSHAYRQRLSTTTTIQQICDLIYQGADNKEISELMTVDQSAAFDTLSHSTLIGKLRLYGLGQGALDWISDFLHNRSQYVKIGGASSIWKTLVCGVPQGSVLGPLLYSIYVNDMTEAVRDNNCVNIAHENNDELFGTPCNTCGELILYADDATYHVANTQRQDNQRKLSSNILNIQQYLNNNDLSMNIGKTTVLECMVRQRKCHNPGDPPPT